MNEWHADVAQLTAFRDGALSPVAATSIEQHLIGCARCRSTLAGSTATTADDGERRERIWAGIADRIDRPSRDWHGHWWLQTTIGTPALGWAALALLVVLVSVPLIAAFGSTRAAVVVLYAVAPLAPVLGAVVAYRTETDPAGELASASPLASARLVLLRAGVVLAVATPVGIVASAILPLPLHLVLGWLVPGLALCAVVLACASRVDPTRLAGGLAVGWAAAVGAAFAGSRDLPVEAALDQIFVNQPAVQLASVFLAAAAATIVVARRGDARPWSAP